MPSSHSKLLCCLLAATMLYFATPNIAEAQDGKFIGGLLRELLESQLERKLRKQQAARPQLVVPQQRRDVAISVNARKARGYFNSFGTESAQLVKLLRQDAARVPGVRRHLDQVLKLQTRCELLNTRYAKVQTDALLLEDIRELDRDWRMVNHRVSRLRGLSNNCKQSLGRLDEINTQCCALFDVGPQLNRREISRLSVALAAELEHLERDVAHELQSQPGARKWILELRRTAVRAQLLSDSALDGDSADSIALEFKQFMKSWTMLSRTLNTSNDRHVARTVEQINEITRGLHEQLWLPIGIDREQITLLATRTSERVKALNDTFSLSMLTELTDGPAILGAAKALNVETAHICESVAGNRSDDDLISHWQELATAWNEYDHYTQAIDSPGIRRLRQEISLNIEAMRQGLGVELVFDRRDVVRYAAELEAIAEQAQHHVGQWQRRPGANIDAGLIRSAKKLIADCHHLHEECSGRASREHLARDCNKLARDWSKLRPQLMTCRTVDQRTLERISDDATSHLIHLQTMLGPQ